MASEVASNLNYFVSLITTCLAGLQSPSYLSTLQRTNILITFWSCATILFAFLTAATLPTPAHWAVHFQARDLCSADSSPLCLKSRVRAEVVAVSSIVTKMASRPLEAATTTGFRAGYCLSGGTWRGSRCVQLWRKCCHACENLTKPDLKHSVEMPHLSSLPPCLPCMFSKGQEVPWLGVSGTDSTSFVP